VCKRGKIRVLQVVGGMVRGGVETWLVQVLRGIDRDRFKLDFLVHTEQPCAYDAEVRRLGSRIIPCLHPSRPFRYVRNLKKILCENGPYDIVHSHLYLFSGLVLRTAEKSGVPIRISHVYPQADMKEGKRLRPVYRRLMTRWLSKYATVTLACSRSSLRTFSEICDISSHHKGVIYPVVGLKQIEKKFDKSTIRRSFSLPQNEQIVVYVARFVPHKNHEQLLRLADRFRTRGKRIHFAVAGSHGESLERVKKECAWRDNVTLFLGLENISYLLLAADMFFFPSLEEGFGIVALEAMAAGLPVVATDLPAIREVCSPSFHQFMFMPNDDDAAYLNMLKILNDEELKTRLSLDAREWSREFSIENSVKKIVRMYEMNARS